MNPDHDLDDILDSLFHGAALTAFVQQANLQGGWPCPTATRQRAYCLYEESLADKNAIRRKYDTK